MNIKSISNRVTYCKKCFMTGKQCSYQDIIENRLNKVSGLRATEGKAFFVMPFSEIMNELYETQLKPCINHYMKDGSNRADEVGSIGYIICERICKEIQESQIVCVELSSENKNVYYETGFAYALRKPIIILKQYINPELEKNDGISGLPRDIKVNHYEPFSYGVIGNEVSAWINSNQYVRNNSMGELGIFVILSDTRYFVENVGSKLFGYRIDDICKNSIGWALKKTYLNDLPLDYYILNQGEYIQELHHRASDFYEIQFKIEESDCMIICTSENEPLSYFWLGYAHALGKNVVPISAAGEKYTQNREGKFHKIDFDHEIPFDVKALWHIHFEQRSISGLRERIRDVLEIIRTNEAIG